MHTRHHIRSDRQQAGFSIITATFLIVVIAALAAFAVNLSRTQHSATALDERGTRALLAAEVGIEWQAWRSLRNGACLPSPALVVLAMPGTGTLAGLSTTVQCTRTVSTDGDQITLDRIVATSCNQLTNLGVCTNDPANVDYIERRLEASVER